MKIKIKKKSEKKFFIIDSDYFSVSGENSVTILLGHGQDYVARQVGKELYYYLDCSGCESCLEKEDMVIISPSEYVSIRKFDDGTNYLHVFKKDDKFCLEVYVDNELVLS